MDGRLRTRLAPVKAPVLPSDLYFSKKTTHLVALKRAQGLLDAAPFAGLTLHGMGACIAKPIALALHLRALYPGQLRLAITTDTVRLADQVSSLEPDADDEIQERSNSAIHIAVYKVEPSKGPTRDSRTWTGV